MLYFNLKGGVFVNALAEREKKTWYSIFVMKKGKIIDSRNKSVKLNLKLDK